MKPENALTIPTRGVSRMVPQMKLANFRISQDEADMVSELCLAFGCSKSEMMRRIIHHAYDEIGERSTT